MGFNDKAIRQELDNQIGGVAREMAQTDDEKKKEEARRRARDLVRRRSYHVDDEEIATYGQRKEGFTYEEWKPFPKDKVNRQIDKKKAEGNVGDSRTLRAVSNYKTRNTDFSKADQKFVGSDRAKSQAKKAKHSADADRHWDKADKHMEKADKHEKKKTEAKLSNNLEKAEKHAAKEKKHLDKADDSERAGNRAANRHDAMTAVHKAYGRAKPSEDKKQEEINKKSKEDRAKAKRMLKATGLESSYNKPAVSGSEKGFKKESLNFTQYLEAQCDPLYEVKGALPKCPPGYRYSMEQKQCVPKTDKDDVRQNKGGSKDSHPSNGPGYNVWGRTGVNGDGYAWAEPNAYEGNYYDGPSGGYYNE